MDRVYVVEQVDPTFQQQRVVGVYEAEGLAEMARAEADRLRSSDQLDRGVFYRITAFTSGKLYI